MRQGRHRSGHPREKFRGNGRSRARAHHGNRDSIVVLESASHAFAWVARERSARIWRHRPRPSCISAPVDDGGIEGSTSFWTSPCRRARCGIDGREIGFAIVTTAETPEHIVECARHLRRHVSTPATRRARAVVSSGCVVVGDENCHAIM